MSSDAATRTVPVGFTLHNPHGVPLTFFESLRRNEVCFAMMDERRWFIHFDKPNRTAVIRPIPASNT